MFCILADVDLRVCLLELIAEQSGHGQLRRG